MLTPHPLRRSERSEPPWPTRAASGIAARRRPGASLAPPVKLPGEASALTDLTAPSVSRCRFLSPGQDFSALVCRETSVCIAPAPGAAWFSRPSQVSGLAAANLPG